MRRKDAPSRQAGAALVVVLLLIATLSFIVLAISERMVLATSRATNARVRSELLWRAVGAEALAAAALSAAVKSEGFRYAPDHPFFAATQEIPLENGGAVMRFADMTRCFNVNSLVAAIDGEPGANETAAAELARIVEAAGADDVSPERFSAAVVDWIDADSFQEPQGAEDGHYAGLPAPYRTGSALLADISELRAIAGVGRTQYEAIVGFLCALPTAAPTAINVNMLTENDAPLVAGLLGGELSLAKARDAIAGRPPGGYGAIEEFWAEEALAGIPVVDEVKARASLASQFIAAFAAIRFADQSVELIMVFEVSESGKARLVSRRLGSIE